MDVTFTHDSPNPPRHPLLDAELDRQMEALFTAYDRDQAERIKRHLRAWLRDRWEVAASHGTRGDVSRET